MSRSLLLTALAVALAAGPALAADFTISLPTVTGSPGQLVSVPITISPAPAGHGIVSIDFRLALDPSFVFASSSSADGFLQSWGPPYVNGTASYLAATTAGVSPLTSGSTLVNTVQLRISPKATIGGNLPLTFQHFLFNEGTPTIAVTSGVLQVRASAADVPPLADDGLSLALASPCPAARDARFALAVPAGASGELAVFALDGRRVRELGAALAPGPHALRWDLRDERGERVAAGLYFVRLRAGERQRVQRVVVAG